MGEVSGFNSHIGGDCDIVPLSVDNLLDGKMTGVSGILSLRYFN